MKSPLDLKYTMRAVVRKRAFQVNSVEGAITVLKHLLSERHTGKVIVSTHQGGVVDLAAEDSMDLPEV